jgi:hypothetical protein
MLFKLTPEQPMLSLFLSAALPDPCPAPIEKFVIRADQTGRVNLLVLEWERTRVSIPVEAAK